MPHVAFKTMNVSMGSVQMTSLMGSFFFMWYVICNFF